MALDSLTDWRRSASQDEISYGVGQGVGCSQIREYREARYAMDGEDQ